MAKTPAARPLSAREIEVLDLVALGRSNREIGVSLAIKDGTVKSHLKRIFQKLGASSRTQAAVVALRRGDLRL